MKRDSLKKERTFMVVASAFVLVAFTMTGVYMKNQEAKYKSDGYQLDVPKTQKNAADGLAEDYTSLGENAMERGAVTEDDLDYSPVENLSPVDSTDIKIPGLTQEFTSEKENVSIVDTAPVQELNDIAAEVVEEQLENGEAMLHFDKKLLFPVYGEVLMPFNMDGSVYFKTLDQYRYNPAMVISAEEGASVSISAAGIVKDIYQDAQLGQVLVLDVGDGYEVIYGQLKDITYGVGSYVETGTTIASVCGPTKYYSEEGSNLYFQVKRDGVPIDPKQFLEN